MRKFLIILAIHAVLVSGPVHADPRTDELKANLEFLKKNYPVYLDKTFRTQVLNFLSWRMVDYLAATQQLSAQAQVSSTATLRARDAFTKLYAQAVLGGAEGIERLSVDLGAELSVIDRESRSLSLIREDYRLLSELWMKRCSDVALKYPLDFFIPAKLYNINRIELKSPGTPITVGFNVSNGYGGGVGNPEFFSQSDGIVILGASIAGSYILPGVGTIVGALIGSGAVTIKNVIIFGGEMSEQDELVSTINRFQADQIGALQERGARTIREVCREAMPESVPLSVSGAHNVGDVDGQSIQRVIDGNLAFIVPKSDEAALISARSHSEYDALGDKLHVLLRVTARNYLTHVRKSLLADIQTEDDELTQSDAGVEKDLGTILPLIAQRKSEVLPATRVQLGQDLFDAMVTAEALHGLDSNFSDFTLWKQTESFVSEEMSR
jgi:hypothetical protein